MRCKTIDSTTFDSHGVCSLTTTYSLHASWPYITITGESCQVFASVPSKEPYDHLDDQLDHDQHDDHNLLLGGRLHSNQLLLHHTEAHNVSVPGPTCIAQHLVLVDSVWVISTLLLWVCRVLARLVEATPFGEGFVNQQLFHLRSTPILIVCS